MTRVAIITDNDDSWSLADNQRLVDKLVERGHVATLARTAPDAPDADIAVYLNCQRIVPARDRERFASNVVVHASDLPRGRGWSPLSWSILAGADTVTVSLFEAVDALDAGDIYLQAEMRFEGHELIDELRAALTRTTHDLVLAFVDGWPNLPRHPQVGEPTSYPRRRPKDSKLDADKPLRESFNLLRIVDNERYPAYFEHAGYIYELRITKRGPAE